MHKQDQSDPGPDPTTGRAAAVDSSPRRGRNNVRSFVVTNRQYRYRRVSACGILLAWLIVFTSGVIVPSGPFRAFLSAEIAGLDPANALDQSSVAGPQTTAPVEATGAPGIPTAPDLAERSASATPAVFTDDVSSAPSGLIAVPVSERTLQAITLVQPQRSFWREVLVFCLGALVTVMSFVGATISYTPPNLGILCCCAAVLGAQLREIPRLKVRDQINTATSATPQSVTLSRELEHDCEPDRRLSTTAALLRGFTVFIAIIGGLLVLEGTPFKETTPEQYMRLAGFGSLFGFLAGYSPQFVSSLLRRAAGMFGDPQTRRGKTAADHS